MSQELDAPKMPAGTYPELSPNPNSEGLKLKDGGRGTPVVVNTEPRKANTNTITVNEVKRLIREAIDHFEKEEGGVTEAEMESYVANAIASKADKVGELPYFEVNKTDKVKDFILNNNVDDKPIVLKLISTLEPAHIFIGVFKFNSGQTAFSFELEAYASATRYSYPAVISINNVTFDDLIVERYKANYALERNACLIHQEQEGTILTETMWSKFKTGDILKVNNMQFIIDVFETTGEGAYKGVTGTMVGAVTSNSITIASLDWRTDGEGYTALEPTLTTLTIPSAE